MIPRRVFVHALGKKTSSQARADRRGNVLHPIHVSATLVCHTEENAAEYLRGKGLEWTGTDVRPIATRAPSRNGAA